MSVSPSSLTISSGGSQQFVATLKSTSNTAVRWHATAGTISTSGAFTAPSVTAPLSIKVIATSVANQNLIAMSEVMVVPLSKLAITNTSLEPGTPGTPYSAKLEATGGSAPYQWHITAGSLPKGVSLDASSGVISGTASGAGKFPFTAAVTDSTTATSTKSLSLAINPTSSATGNFDGPAELPRVYIQSKMSATPAPGTTIPVHGGGNLQQALDTAQCGDVIELQAGVTFSGSFKLPAKPCDDQHWIVIRTAAPDAALPAEGTRVSPCYSGVASLPGRPKFGCASTRPVLARVTYSQTSGSGPFIIQPGANHYRLLGLEISRSEGTGFIGPLISVKRGGAADHFVIDRSWLHGSVRDETISALALTGMTYVSVVDSYINDFHCTSMVGSCTDAHAVSGGLGSVAGGPYQIVNNFLEAAGENVLFGGGQATANPADIEIRQNHFFKPMFWMPGSPSFVGGAGGHPFVVKNHLELKNAQRVLVEGNIFENSWGGFSQNGYSILLTPKNQAQGTGNICPDCLVADVTIRYNFISHVGAGMQIATALSDNGGAARAGTRFSIHDITIDDISASKYHGGGGLFQILNTWTTNVLSHVSINHVTGFPESPGHILAIGNNRKNPPMTGFVFTNNIVIATKYPVWQALGNGDCAGEALPRLIITSCFTTYAFTHDALISNPTTPTTAPASTWPLGNFLVASVNVARFVNFNNGNGGDYHLLPSSPFKNAGTDGKDLGADIDAIQAATAGVY